MAYRFSIERSFQPSLKTFPLNVDTYMTDERILNSAGRQKYDDLQNCLSTKIIKNYALFQEVLFQDVAKTNIHPGNLVIVGYTESKSGILTEYRTNTILFIRPSRIEGYKVAITIFGDIFMVEMQKTQKEICAKCPQALKAMFPDVVREFK